jgi:hypothetical protein
MMKTGGLSEGAFQEWIADGLVRFRGGKTWKNIENVGKSHSNVYQVSWFECLSSDMFGIEIGHLPHPCFTLW